MPRPSTIEGYEEELDAADALIQRQQERIERLEEALRGPDLEMPEAIQPIGWLHTMIEDCKRRGPDREDDDPDAYWEMIAEVEWLYRHSRAALAEGKQ